MYKMYDKTSAIKEIQEYLSRLSLTNTNVVKNGIYDEKTKDAVISFQADMGLNANGVVDYDTFTLLYSEYINAQIVQNVGYNLGQNDLFDVSLGDYGNHVEKINSMMAEVLDYFGAYHSLRVSKYYSEESNAAHLELRKIFGMDEGVLDELFYERLTKELKSIGDR